MTALAPAAPIGRDAKAAARRRRARPASWLAVGLYAALAITLLAPLVVAFLWSIVDPKAGWFAPNILPRVALASITGQAIAERPRPGAEHRRQPVHLGGGDGALRRPRAARPPTRSRRSRSAPKRAVEMFILAPLIVPGLIVGVGIGYVFFRVGLAYTIPGVILAQTIGTLPFMIRVLVGDDRSRSPPTSSMPRARSAPRRSGSAGTSLVPLAWPGFIAGGLLSFVASFEEFEKTFIVGAPLVETLTVKLWATLGGKVMIFPNAAVVTFIVLVPTVIIFFLAERAMRNDSALAAGMGKL